MKIDSLFQHWHLIIQILKIFCAGKTVKIYRSELWEKSKKWRKKRVMSIFKQDLYKAELVPGLPLNPKYVHTEISSKFRGKLADVWSRDWCTKVIGNRDELDQHIDRIQEKFSLKVSFPCLFLQRVLNKKRVVARYLFFSVLILYSDWLLCGKAATKNAYFFCLSVVKCVRTKQNKKSTRILIQLYFSKISFNILAPKWLI